MHENASKNTTAAADNDRSRELEQKLEALVSEQAVQNDRHGAAMNCMFSGAPPVLGFFGFKLQHFASALRRRT